MGGKKSKKVQILLVAISKEIAKRYAQIAKLAGLKVTVLETESFSLARSLIKSENGRNPDSVIIADIGSRTTNIIVISNGLVMKNHSVDTSGDEITRALSYGLGVDFDRAEFLKRNFGLECQGINGKKICEIAVPLADMIMEEIEKMMRYYSSKKGGQVKKIILTGGSANLKGLDNYFNKKLGLTVEKGNPWKGLSYPASLAPVLRGIAPSFSVAAGLAIAGFEGK
ncbi:MAG: pilus assembly protein PilM [Nitrospiraceae bacterium]|nr:pilus assembly protein PilM [Nitrospiraceae bacterium]